VARKRVMIMGISAKIPTATRKLVYERDNRTCVLCGDNRVIHIHHINGHNVGYANEPHNLVCLCPTCHAIAHGEYTKNDFPTNQETAQDALNWYIWEENWELYGIGLMADMKLQEALKIETSLHRHESDNR
jgi:hypothetical protein